MTDTPDAAYFDRLYANAADPWGYTTSAYEAEKYAATIAALDGRRFRRGLEIGCSIGVLSHRLAESCDVLVAVDFSATALARATLHDRIAFRRMAVPAQWPEGRFDLVVISEVLYYLSLEQIAATVTRIDTCLDPDGVVVLVNWLGETGVALDGDTAAETFIRRAAPGLCGAMAERRAGYRLDRLVRRPPEAG